jgi:hypothetical protein
MPELSAADAPAADQTGSDEAVPEEQPTRRLVLPQQETAPTRDRNRSDGTNG